MLTTPNKQSPATAGRPIAPLIEIRRGQWVKVKSSAEIEQTLDADGTLDGLPFMPEMVDLCGQHLQVIRFANQVCANIGTVEIRQLQHAVVLNVNRCDGKDHDRCEMGCDFLWKSQWLESVEEGFENASQGEHADRPTSQQTGAPKYRDVEFHRRLVQIASAADDQGTIRHRCQATELGTASKQASAFNLQQYRIERETNGTSLLAIGKFLWATVVRKLRRQNENCEGPCRRTPVSDLQLEIGDRVRVKTFEQIVDTLDSKGCNRGLWFDQSEMKPFCGSVMTVTRKVTRLIDEHDGRLLELKVPSVVLNETQCSGLKRRFCGRGMLHFWREVWLEKDG